MSSTQDVERGSLLQGTPSESSATLVGSESNFEEDGSVDPGTPVTALGFTILHDHRNAEYDIVFVHGLQGHPEETWATTGDEKIAVAADATPEATPEAPKKGVWSRFTGIWKSAPEKTPIFWPRDLLSKDPKYKKCRIMTYGYDSNISRFFGGAADQSGIYQHGINLCQLLARTRATTRNRPLIFAVHSLGGLVVKECLCQSRSSADIPENADLRALFLSTVGIAFFGTPHRGGGENFVGYGQMAAKISAIAGFDVNPKNLKGLDSTGTSDELERLRKEFLDLVDERRLPIQSFQESAGFKGTSWFGANKKIVPDSSSGLDVPTERKTGLPGNHMEICRIPSVTDVRYHAFTLQALDYFMERASFTLRGTKPIHDEVDRSLWNGMTRDERLKEVRDSLSGRDLSYRERNIAEEHKNTFSWVWNEGEPGFRDWLCGDDPMFWIYGWPASGKSTLMKYMFNHANTNALLNPDKSQTIVKVAFFFYDRGTQDQKSLSGLIMCILLQFLKEDPKLGDFVLPIYDDLEKIKGKVDWNLDALKRALKAICCQHQYQITIFFFVDALDEYDGKNREIADFFLDLAKTAKSETGDGPRTRLKMCLSSRPETAFQSGFKKIPQMAIHNYTLDDIRSYVRSIFDDSEQLSNGPWVDQEGKDSDADAMVTHIAKVSRGVFLWAKLVAMDLVELAEGGAHSKALWEHLRGIPPDLTELYSRIVEKISADAIGNQSMEGYAMLEMVRCAEGRQQDLENFAFTFDTQFREGLKPGETIPNYYACWLANRVDDGMTARKNRLRLQLQSCCRGLLVVSDTPWHYEEGPAEVLRVEFLHQTVKTFVLSGGHAALIENRKPHLRDVEPPALLGSSMPGLDGYVMHVSAFLKLWIWIANLPPGSQVTKNSSITTRDIRPDPEPGSKVFMSYYPSESMGVQLRAIDGIDATIFQQKKLEEYEQFCSDSTATEWWFNMAVRKRANHPHSRDSVYQYDPIPSIPSSSIGRRQAFAAFYGLYNYLAKSPGDPPASSEPDRMILEYAIEGLHREGYYEKGGPLFRNVIDVLIQKGLIQLDRDRAQKTIFKLAQNIFYWSIPRHRSTKPRVQAAWNGFELLLKNGVKADRKLAHWKVKFSGKGNEDVPKHQATFFSGLIRPIEIAILSRFPVPRDGYKFLFEMLNREPDSQICTDKTNSVFCAFLKLCIEVPTKQSLPEESRALTDIINLLLDHGGRFPDSKTLRESVMPCLQADTSKGTNIFDVRWYDEQYFDSSVWGPEEEVWEKVLGWLKGGSTIKWGGGFDLYDEVESTEE